VFGKTKASNVNYTQECEVCGSGLLNQEYIWILQYLVWINNVRFYGQCQELNCSKMRYYCCSRPHLPYEMWKWMPLLVTRLEKPILLNMHTNSISSPDFSSDLPLQCKCAATYKRLHDNVSCQVKLHQVQFLKDITFKFVGKFG
jgi:hypothetical protein